MYPHNYGHPWMLPALVHCLHKALGWNAFKFIIHIELLFTLFMFFSHRYLAFHFGPVHSRLLRDAFQRNRASSTHGYPWETLEEKDRIYFPILPTLFSIFCILTLPERHLALF